MSLHYGDPPKYQTKEERVPPRYEELVPILSQREITFYLRHWSGDAVCFTSQDAATKYKCFKNANFKHVINLQKLGIGIPLMEAQFKRYPGLGETKFATIFKCVPPPPDSNRTFNKKTDKFEFCTVLRKREWNHTRYTFIILPNKNKPSDTFKFSMFVHSKLPIIDVSPIRGSDRRYRWIITNRKEYYWKNYTYGLFWLDENQESMVDNMDVANQKLDKTNSVLNIKSCKFSKEKINEYISMGRVGELLIVIKIGCDPLYLPKDKVGELTRKEGNNKITMSTLQEGNRSLHVSQPQDVDLQSIDSVGVHELALTCMSYVLNYIEERNIR